MTHPQIVTYSLLVCVSLTLSIMNLRAFDMSRLDTTDQALLTGLKVPQVIRSLRVKATSGISLTATDVAVLTPILQSAQAKGIPLSALMYEEWMGQNQMRHLLTIEFKRSFMNGGVAWKYVPSMIDVFLAARDSPPSLYFNSKYTYKERQEMIGLEQFLRDTILDNLWHLAYPDESKRPPRSDAGSDGGNAPTLKRMLDRILADPSASISAVNREVLTTQLTKVEAFVTNPPPLSVPLWREKKVHNAWHLFWRCCRGRRGSCR